MFIAFYKRWVCSSKTKSTSITCYFVCRELIHTASLLHDDVVDMADTRRGLSSVNHVFGNKLAVLGGDFLLARASVSLARLRNVDVRHTAVVLC